MKKTFILLGFVGFSIVCFSQTTSINNIDNKPIQKVVPTLGVVVVKNSTSIVKYTNKKKQIKGTNINERAILLPEQKNSRGKDVLINTVKELATKEKIN